MISSLNNATVKATAKLAKRRERDRRRMLLVEGHRAAAVALASGVTTRLFLHTPSARLRVPLLDAATASGAKVVEVTVSVMRHLTSHEHPPSVLAVCAQRPVAARQAASGDLIVVLSGMRDPAVAGGMLAAAAAAGATAAISLEGSTDPFSPAAVRAGAGAHFLLNVARDVPASDAAAALGRRDLFALTNDGMPVCSASMKRPLALVICGGEVPSAFERAARVCVPEGSHGILPGPAARAAVALYAIGAAE